MVQLTDFSFSTQQLQPEGLNSEWNIHYPIRNVNSLKLCKLEYTAFRVYNILYVYFILHSESKSESNAITVTSTNGIDKETLRMYLEEFSDHFHIQSKGKAQWIVKFDDKSGKPATPDNIFGNITCVHSARVKRKCFFKNHNTLNAFRPMRRSSQTWNPSSWSPEQSFSKCGDFILIRTQISLCPAKKKKKHLNFMTFNLPQMFRRFWQSKSMTWGSQWRCTMRKLCGGDRTLAALS